jgi:hypothetical protein
MIEQWLQVIWRWCRVLWVCRVPAASVLAAGALLRFTPQALDLFADLGLGWVGFTSSFVVVFGWACFFILVFVWAWIVHAVARRALRHDEWIPEAHCADGLSPRRREELQALFWRPAIWIPRGLGLGVFFVVGWAICRARINLLDARAGLSEADLAVTQTNVLLVVTIVLAAIYLLSVWKRRPIADYVAARTRCLSGPMPPLLAGTGPILSGDRSRAYAQRSAPPRTWVDAAFLLVSLALSVGFFAMLSHPHLFTDLFPRVLFVPILLGGWVIAGGELASWSHRLQTPLLLILFGIATATVYTFNHFNDTRWVTSQPMTTGGKVADAGATRSLPLAKAVQRWKKVNNCAEAGQICPAPIIIAGAGGASRAAFMTATVVGAMIDLGLSDPDRYGNVRNRIFAMSTVSGSSLGAVVMRAALADAAEEGSPDRPPCRQPSDGAWFGSTRVQTRQSTPGSDVASRYDVKKSWRDCFQQLLAGDFLSPVIAGVAYRDNLLLGNPLTRRAFWPDRAVLLEQAFERRYHHITERGASLCSEDIGDGLCRRMGYHPDPDKIGGAWLPLLFINGTSVATGRRIIAGDVRAGDCVDGDGTLFNLAYDVAEIRAWKQQDCKSPDPKEQLADLYLSTTATMSARFPLISPHGLLRDATGNVIDRIVDGGYFENDGLATAADLVSVLQKPPYDLKPIVIRIRNEPVKLPDGNRRLGPHRPDLPDDSESALFDVYASIFRTLVATRSGHEDGHAEYLVGILGRTGDQKSDRLVEINVHSLEKAEAGPFCRQSISGEPKLKTVSMSWWMSQPVQAYLDAQLCVRANSVRLECELRRDSNPANCPAAGEVRADQTSPEPPGQKLN